MQNPETALRYIRVLKVTLDLQKTLKRKNYAKQIFFRFINVFTIFK